MTVKVVVATKAADVPKEPVDGKPTIVYWNILGLVQPIRLSLAAAKVDFVDVRIEAGDDPKHEDHKKAWLDAKPTLPLAFPNLPYFLDGKSDVKLTQSNTILRFIGRKYDMLGPEEHLTDLALDQLADMEGNIAVYSYQRGPDALLAWYKDKVPALLDKFKPLVLKQDTFLFGVEKATIADFKFYVFLFKLTVIQEKLGTADTSSILADWVHAYMKRIEALPGVAEYMASPQYMKSPMNNPVAMWRG